MNIMMAGFFGGYEILLILGVVLILFGGKKLPELAKGLGNGIKEFKKASSEVTEEIQSTEDEPTPPPPPRKLPPANTESAISSAQAGAPKDPTSAPKV